LSRGQVAACTIIRKKHSLAICFYDIYVPTHTGPSVHNKFLWLLTSVFCVNAFHTA
jgi:hypothetical protein